MSGKDIRKILVEQSGIDYMPEINKNQEQTQIDHYSEEE
jgi:hypothetical protein